MADKKIEEKVVTPVAVAPVKSEGSEIASAIAEGFKKSKESNFAFTGEEGIDHRFSVVKNKDGEVMLRENESGTLSKIQLLSIEEKEASIQGQDVEEI